MQTNKTSSKSIALLAAGFMTVILLGLGFAAVTAPTPAFAGVGSDFICCTVWVDGPSGNIFAGHMFQEDGGGGGGGGGHPAPACILTASDYSITAGESVVITWETVRLSSFSINQGIGVVTPTAGGSVTVSPTVNTTYTGTGVGLNGQNVTCTTTIIVPPPQNGCILILKETYDTNGGILFPVAQFTFNLDGVRTAVNDAAGVALFSNVTPGTHQVTEFVPPTWVQLSVTPINGTVVVPAGPVCAAVVFKNKQVIEPGECKLEITKSVDKTDANVGEVFEYTINFKNTGNADCTGGGVKVVDAFDSQIMYVSNTHSSNVTEGYGADPVYDAVAHVLKWNANTLTPGEEGWVKWKGKVKNMDAQDACSTTVPNKAKITSAEYNNFTDWVESNTVNVHVTKDCTPPPKVTLKAKKVICDTEADLPNWGAGGPNITATTADDYVATHPHCHIALGWKFEYADGDTPNPGDNVGIAGGAWTTFVDDNLDGIAEAIFNLSSLGNASKIWVREAIPPDYVPFAGVGIDNVSAELYCHTDVLNYDNYDFINNPAAGQTYQCVGFNALKPPPPNKGCIQVLKETYDTNGNPLTPVAQFSFKLDGGVTVQNDANGNAIFNNVTLGAHQVTEVNPGATWTLLSTTPINGNVVVTAGPVCAAVVFKNKQIVSVPHTPACTLHANPTSFNAPGGTTTLTWTSENVTSFSIDHSIGLVTPVAGGSTTTPVTTTTTYTGTGTGPYGTVTCSDIVTVTPPPGPSCNLTINKNDINTGESVVVSWTSNNVTSGVITPQVGNASPVASGSSDPVYPPTDTTYTGVFTGPYGTATCTVQVRVHTPGCQGSCGGGGYNPPNVVLFKKPGDQPLASVFLSQIPYTGFEAGPILTLTFWLAVALFSAIIAYYMVGRGSLTYVFGRIASLAGVPSGPAFVEHDTEEPTYEETYGPPYPATEIEPTPITFSVAAPAAPRVALEPAVSDIATKPEPTGIPDIEDVIESRAHAAGILMSPESVQLAARLSSDRAEALRAFGDILNEAVKTIPREDGWVMLTSNRFEDLAAKRAVAPKASAMSFAPAQKMTANVEPIVSSVDEASAIEFAQALLSRDRTTAFAIIRSLEHDTLSPSTLITGVATVLDRLYRVRHGGANGVDQELLAKAALVNDENLHTLVETFAHALDTVYANPFTGIKLALGQAFEILG